MVAAIGVVAMARWTSTVTPRSMLIAVAATPPLIKAATGLIIARAVDKVDKSGSLTKIAFVRVVRQLLQNRWNLADGEGDKRAPAAAPALNLVAAAARRRALVRQAQVQARARVRDLQDRPPARDLQAPVQVQVQVQVQVRAPDRQPHRLQRDPPAAVTRAETVLELLRQRGPVHLPRLARIAQARGIFRITAAGGGAVVLLDAPARLGTAEVLPLDAPARSAVAGAVVTQPVSAAQRAEAAAVVVEGVAAAAADEVDGDEIYYQFYHAFYAFKPFGLWRFSGCSVPLLDRSCRNLRYTRILHASGSRDRTERRAVGKKPECPA